MNILLVTSYRSWEVRDPLAQTDATVRTIEIDPTNTIVTRFLDVWRKSRQAIREDDIDVVFLDVYEVPGLAAWLAAKLTGVPIVVRMVGDRLHDLSDDHIIRAREQGNFAELVTYLVMHAMNRLIITRSDGAIVVSTDLKRKLCHRTAFDKTNVQVVPVPFRQGEFQISERDGHRFHPEEEIVLTVTNLKYPSKFEGVKQSLSAIEPILRKRENLYYVVAGDGVYLEEVRAYVRDNIRNDVWNQIVIPGFIKDIRSLYADADVMLYISHLDGYPNVVLEAQGMKLPVIANADFGMVDQIEHGETGLLVDPVDQDHIRKAVIQLLDDENKRTQIGKNAQRRVKRENSLETVGEQYVETLTKIV